jgi:hypothetical protein
MVCETKMSPGHRHLECHATKGIRQLVIKLAPQCAARRPCPERDEIGRAILAGPQPDLLDPP